ncbi:DEAD/DEAH box helicase [Gayadomonas joobiniege]|uniref:DEAD/DEAH box helicase n=1 Tax=Gayadomonas joobiniege TaxID=1234606 RepID=UPI0003634630|nr:DEAD/DEAH box helicase [Gayadomonas joobiniege]
MLINQASAQQICDLKQDFLKLSLTEQIIVRILAVLWIPTSRLQLNVLLNKLQKTDSFNLTITEFTDEQHSRLANLNILQPGPKFCEVNPLLKATLIREAKLNNEYKLVRHLQTSSITALSSHTLSAQKNKDALRVLDYFYLSEYDNLEEQLKYGGSEILLNCCFLPFVPSQLTDLPETIKIQACQSLLQHTLRTGSDLAFVANCIQSLNQSSSEDFNLLAAHVAFYRADWPLFTQLKLEQNLHYQAIALVAAKNFVHGSIDTALAGFKKALQAKNKQKKRRKNQFLNGPLGLMHKLCLLVKGAQGYPQILSEALAQIDFERDKSPNNAIYLPLSRAMRTPLIALQNKQSCDHSYRLYQQQIKMHFFCGQLINFALAVTRFWCNQAHNDEDKSVISDTLQKFNQSGANLFVLLMNNFNKTDKHPLLDLASAFTPKNQWQLALNQLTGQTPNSSNKIHWLLNLTADTVELQCLLKTNKSELEYKTDKVLNNKQLFSEEYNHYFSLQDKQIRQLLNQFEYQGKTFISTEADACIFMLQALNHHANLYQMAAPDQPLQLSYSEPYLQINQIEDNYCLTMPNLPSRFQMNRPAFKIVKLANHHYQFIVFGFSHLRIAQVIGEEGLWVPTAAKQEILATITQIAPQLDLITSDTELSSGLAKVPCETGLWLDIEPYAAGLKFNCFVMPFGPKGPSYPPAFGQSLVTALVGGQRLETHRNLIQEQEDLAQLDICCPGFRAMHGHQLVLEDSQKALDLLSQIQAFSNHPQPSFKLTVRWPKGVKISLSKPLTASQIQLSIYKNQQWFDFTGEVQINDQQTLSFQQLLSLYQHQQRQYIELNPEHYLQLSDDLKHKMDMLLQISEQGQFHPLATEQMDKAIQGMRLKTLHGWAEQKRVMQAAWRAKINPPAELRANLRDYQKIGIEWALRLASWRAGACLADEMGLGKTLQAVAIMLARAKKGPSLVLAPASVVYNWANELKKFAPNLHTYSLSNYCDHKQRVAKLDNTKPGDVILLSYGLLVSLKDELAAIEWTNLVADEAQMLKNPLSQRTKIVYELNAHFKMVMTGTPIENDLTELWSLFRIINPGLLGNLKRFNQKFIQPIANQADDPIAASQAKAGLKLLIDPFILRRTKKSVATELPEKTEIYQGLELATDYQSFYEAARLNALKIIHNQQTEGPSTQKNIAVLAQLVRLRQACCDPRLLIPNSDLKSPKLTALKTLVPEIVNNGHQVLIFSQFVGFLKLVQEALAQIGIDSAYLDGATPSDKRQKQIKIFQNGEKPVFLISLKAGGTGLNLTAASYVIHLDPWWNPAVSQQASDRAHRLGQNKPVTIYHFYCKNTIESQILALHQKKSKLAYDLLVNQDQIVNTSVKEILNLLQTSL